MKALRVLILISALAVCAYADGNMPNGAPGTSSPASTAGNMPNGGAGEVASGAFVTTEPTITEAVLSLLHSVLSVF